MEDSQQIILPPVPEAPNALHDFPNRDSPSSSASFLDKFKYMLSATVLPTWETFESFIDEFVNFSQGHVNLKKDDEVPPAIFKQDNPLNPKYIQALYCCNRHCAVRKVIGENTKACTVEPNLLADHFYNKESVESDNTIYDNWEAEVTKVLR